MSTIPKRGWSIFNKQKHDQYKQKHDGRSPDKKDKASWSEQWKKLSLSEKEKYHIKAYQKSASKPSKISRTKMWENRDAALARVNMWQSKLGIARTVPMVQTKIQKPVKPVKPAKSVKPKKIKKALTAYNTYIMLINDEKLASKLNYIAWAELKKGLEKNDPLALKDMAIINMYKEKFNKKRLGLQQEVTVQQGQKVIEQKFQDVTKHTSPQGYNEEIQTVVIRRHKRKKPKKDEKNLNVLRDQKIHASALKDQELDQAIKKVIERRGKSRSKSPSKYTTSSPMLQQQAIKKIMDERKQRKSIPLLKRDTPPMRLKIMDIDFDSNESASSYTPSQSSKQSKRASDYYRKEILKQSPLSITQSGGYPVPADQDTVEDSIDLQRAPNPFDPDNIYYFNSRGQMDRPIGPTVPRMFRSNDNSLVTSNQGFGSYIPDETPKSTIQPQLYNYLNTQDQQFDDQFGGRKVRKPKSKGKKKQVKQKGGDGLFSWFKKRSEPSKEDEVAFSNIKEQLKQFKQQQGGSSQDDQILQEQFGGRKVRKPKSKKPKSRGKKKQVKQKGGYSDNEYGQAGGDGFFSWFKRNEPDKKDEITLNNIKEQLKHFQQQKI